MQAQVRGAESCRATGRTSTVVERTVLRAFAWWRIVVRPGEHVAFPPPATSSGRRIQPSVADAGLELRAIDSVCRERREDVPPAPKAIRVEMQGDAERCIEWRP